VLLAGVAQRADQRLSVGADRDYWLVGRVACRQPAADVQQGRGVAVSLAHHVGESDHRMRCRRERIEVANLRPDVAVEPQQLKPRIAKYLLDGAKGIPIQQVEAELAVALPCAYQRVRVGVHLRRNSYQYGHFAHRQLPESRNLLEVVQHNRADARLQRHLQLGVGFVDAVHVDVCGWEACLQRGIQFAADATSSPSPSSAIT
jgi:hypothetical protein